MVAFSPREWRWTSHPLSHKYLLKPDSNSCRSVSRNLTATNSEGAPAQAQSRISGKQARPEGDNDGMRVGQHTGARAWDEDGAIARVREKFAILRAGCPVG